METRKEHGEYVVKQSRLKWTARWINVYCEFENIPEEHLKKLGYKIEFVKGNSEYWTTVGSLGDACVKHSDREISFRRELLYSYMKVNGGWLIRDYQKEIIYDGGGVGVGMTFIPDPKHENEPIPVK